MPSLNLVLAMSCVFLVGCRTYSKVSSRPNKMSSVSGVIDVVNSARLEAVEIELRMLAKEEGSVAGFERRLEDRGAKIEVGDDPRQRIAIIPISGSSDCYRVVYFRSAGRVLISRIELVSGPPKFASLTSLNNAVWGGRI